MKVNESEILRCGFSEYDLEDNPFDINTIIHKSNNLKILEVLDGTYFNICIDEYCSHLEGFIEKDISIFKCKLNRGRHGWVCKINFDEPYEIKKTDEILNISPEISYKSSYGFTYVIKTSELGYKIGSSRSIHNRSAIFNVKLPFRWEFHRIFLNKRYKLNEKTLHQLFDEKRLEGEWFDLNIDDLAMIEQFMYLNTPT